ncbi:sugar phosphate isomerase/epimerase family protein [Robbsia sp. KACC 23696]|uniref:sugar phosphate isomerase/epimerase family protein n=1 Tax=Robbsia sp. KACC 23696 TaxID=3149231 RepID=UPI00325AA900
MTRDTDFAQDPAATSALPHDLANPLFINTILLGGPTVQKLAAAKAAGFAQVELWRQDVEAYDAGAAALGRHLRQIELGLTDHQVLLDFDGAPDEIRDAKRQEAIALLDRAQALGANTVLVPASTHKACVAARVVDDLRWLAREAATRGLRVAYEGMAWSTLTYTVPAAWATIQAVGEPNMGLVVDAFHMFARGRDANDLRDIPIDRIFLLQLSDLMEEIDLPNIIEIARHRRLLPGQGRFPVTDLVARLLDAGYKGPIGLEVFNDAMKARDPMDVAREAMTALRSTVAAALAETAGASH